MKIDYKVLGKVQELIEEALQTDGDHHKQWYLEQIAKELEIDLSSINYDGGIAP